MNILEISEEEWKKSFAELPPISAAEAIETLREKGELESRRIPNLKLHQFAFERSVLIKNCELEGFNAKGSSFDGGFTMRSAAVADQVNLNNVDVDGKVDLFNCHFERIYFSHLIADHFLIDRTLLGDRLSSEKMGSYQQARVEGLLGIFLTTLFVAMISRKIIRT